MGHVHMGARPTLRTGRAKTVIESRFTGRVGGLLGRSAGCSTRIVTPACAGSRVVMVILRSQPAGFHCLALRGTRRGSGVFFPPRHTEVSAPPSPCIFPHRVSRGRPDSAWPADGGGHRGTAWDTDTEGTRGPRWSAHAWEAPWCPAGELEECGCFSG